LIYGSGEGTQLSVLVEQELTDEQVYEWYRRAMRDEINIFDDHNEIISLLAREVLAQRDVDVKTYTIN
tara:strand:- start:623 stop:826 length:204 start_codon:yes stop_codon:yes gene_type:complete